ncbi:MAG: glycosyltransferase [Pseudomonadota bacterium]|nr:glycosyltransferase [Pseudomonadota bacterium]
MRLAIIPEGPLAYDGKNYFFTNGGGYYIERIATHFDQVTVIGHAFKMGDTYFHSMSEYAFNSENIDFVEMPLKKGFFGKLWQLVLSTKTILKHFKDIDCFYLFMPGYPAAIASILCRMTGKPYMLYLAADWEESADILFPLKESKNSFLRSVFARLVAWFQSQAVRGARVTLTAGRRLQEKFYEYGRPVVETIPRLNWPAFKLYKRDNTCENDVITLLFVGYLLKRKGADYFIEAVKNLNGRGYNVRGVILGSGDQEKVLRQKVEDEGLSQVIDMKGHIANGDQVIQEYRNADIFVLPTLGGEGFPRVLYEALSQSLPIVTTNVCGIPRKLIPNELGLFAPPGDLEAMSNQIERLIKDSSLRQKLINNGLSFMQNLKGQSDGGQQVANLYYEHVEGQVANDDTNKRAA